MKGHMLAWLLIGGLGVALLFSRAHPAKPHDGCDCADICANSAPAEWCNVAHCNGMEGR